MPTPTRKPASRPPAKPARAASTAPAAAVDQLDCPPTAAPLRDRLLRREAMCDKVGMRYTAVYKAMKRGEFPQPVQLPGGWAVAWRESELDEWIDALPRAEEAPCA